MCVGQKLDHGGHQWSPIRWYGEKLGPMMFGFLFFMGYMYIYILWYIIWCIYIYMYHIYIYMYIRDVIWPWHVRHQGSSWAQDFETSHGNSGNGKGWNPAKSCEKNNQLLIGTTIFFLCSTYGAGLKYRRSFKWALQVRWLLHVCLQKWLQECPWPMQLLRQRRPTIVEVSGRFLKAQTLECSISGAKHTQTLFVDRIVSSVLPPKSRECVSLCQFVWFDKAWQISWLHCVCSDWFAWCTPFGKKQLVPWQILSTVVGAIFRHHWYSLGRCKAGDRGEEERNNSTKGLWKKWGSKACWLILAVNIHKSPSGWWFGTWLLFSIYGMSSFPLTNSYFSEG